MKEDGRENGCSVPIDTYSEKDLALKEELILVIRFFMLSVQRFTKAATSQDASPAYNL